MDQANTINTESNSPKNEIGQSFNEGSNKNFSSHYNETFVDKTDKVKILNK